MGSAGLRCSLSLAAAKYLRGLVTLSRITLADSTLAYLPIELLECLQGLLDSHCSNARLELDFHIFSSLWHHSQHDCGLWPQRERGYQLHQSLGGWVSPHRVVSYEASGARR